MSSIHVSSDLSGLARYVELKPKISYPEFRLLQLEQFPMLDSFGETAMTSFREDVLIRQGRGRQRRELRWQSVAFLGLVSVLDYLVGVI